jgi:hypothetical protein
MNAGGVTRWCLRTFPIHLRPRPSRLLPLRLPGCIQERLHRAIHLVLDHGIQEVSLVLMLLRIEQAKAVRRLFWGTIIVQILGIYSILAILLQCIHVHKTWDPIRAVLRTCWRSERCQPVQWRFPSSIYLLTSCPLPTHLLPERDPASDPRACPHWRTNKSWDLRWCGVHSQHRRCCRIRMRR